MSRALPRQPLLRRDALIQFPHRDELRIMLSPQRVTSLRPATPALAEWLQLLDGTRPLAEVVAAAPIERPLVLRLLRELAAAGLLAEANDGLFFRRPATVAADALRLAQQTRVGGGWQPLRASVAVVGPGAWAGRLRTALGVPGVTVRPVGAEGDLLVLLAEALDPGFADASAAAMAVGTPHLGVVISGLDAALLPLTIPGRTGCCRCWLLQRDLRGLDWPAWGMRGRDPDPPRLPAHRVALVLSLVVEHVLGALPAVMDPDQHEALAAASMERYLDFATGSVDVRPVAAHPSCGCVRLAA